MKIKAIHTAWDNKPCIIKQDFSLKKQGYNLLLSKVLIGSCFACNYEQFTFNWYAKFQIFFVKIWYYLKMNLWRKIYRQFPYRIKLFFKPTKKRWDSVLNCFGNGIHIGVVQLLKLNI